MIDPHDVSGPNGPQFRQAQPQDGRLAPPQVQAGVQQAVQQQYGMAAANASQHSFFFRYESQVDGRVYEGQFTVRKLSLRDITMLGVRKVQLNGGYHYDERNPGQGIEEHVDSMNAMVAHLELALVQQPVWFNLAELYDAELLAKLYFQVMDFENNFFRRRDEAGPRGGVPTGSSPANNGSVTNRPVTEVGGGEVPPSLDP